MLDLEKIQADLTEKFGEIDITFRLRPSDQNLMLYIHQDKISTKAKKGFISNRQLLLLKKRIADKYKSDVEIILVQSNNHQELESTFFQLLNRKYDNRIISLFISFANESTMDTHIEVSNLTEKLESEISMGFGNLLREFNFKSGSIRWFNSPTELPTLAVILRSIKSMQPINLSELLKILKPNYSSISKRWLNHMLDQLRKNEFILRQNNETYVLTEKALKKIPFTTTRSSSDIERALALAVKKW